MTRVLLALLLNISLSAAAADYNSISVQGRLDPPISIDNVKVEILATDGSIVGTANDVNLVPDTSGIFSVRLEGFAPDVFLKNTVSDVRLKKSDDTEIAKLPIGSVPFALAIKGDNQTGNVFGASGKVGIGTTSPLYPLTVNGDAQISGKTIISGNEFSVGGSALVIKGGNVGVGTGNPSGVFEVDSPSFFYRQYTNSYQVHSDPRCICDIDPVKDDCGGGYSGSDIGPVCYDWRGGMVTWQAVYAREVAPPNSALVVSQIGNVGIGTVTPGQKLSVAGNLSVEGSIASVGSISSAGTLVTTGGGVKFPDGTVQTTADDQALVFVAKKTLSQSAVTFDSLSAGTYKLIARLSNWGKFGSGELQMRFNNDAGPNYKWANYLWGTTGPTTSTNSSTYIFLSSLVEPGGPIYFTLELSIDNWNHTQLTGTGTLSTRFDIDKNPEIKGTVINGYYYGYPSSLTIARAGGSSWGLTGWVALYKYR